MSAAETQMPRDVLRPVAWALAGLVVFGGAFLGWAMFAVLATTLHLTGTLASETPGFDVQHPYGGQIAEVFVRPQESVKRGDLLLRFDTALDQQKLETLLGMRSRIRKENAIIARLLSDKDVPAGPGSAHLVLRMAQAKKQAAMKQEAATSLSRQRAAQRETIAHQTAQLQQMRARETRITSLTGNGLETQTALDMLQEQIQLVQGEISSQRARLIAQEDQQEQTTGQAALVLLSIRQELASMLESNRKQLEDLALQIADIEDIVRRADLRAPIDGIVTNLPFEASGMYAARGQTLVSLAQPLDTPIITFKISPQQIDQLHVGMSGRLKLPGIPSRGMPDVRATVRAVSPRAETDENARPLFFEGRAEIEPGGVAALRAAIGEDFALSADMPVELLIEGRLTTLSQYLTDPFFAAFRDGLQD